MVEFVSDRMLYIILRGRWCHIIILNVHAPTEDKTDAAKHEEIITDEIIIITRKLYNQPNGIITILIALYLFITLIVVVKITNISKDPLRQTK
jgi:hypothetical protein